MDIEDYLRKKRELEKKKEYLEAKTKLQETKEEIKKEKPQPTLDETTSLEPREPRRPQPLTEPTLKPWMLWDLMILTIMIILFSLTYFFPRTNVEDLKADITNDLKTNLITGAATQQPPPTTQTTQQTTTTNNPPPDNLDDEPQKDLPGPEFTFTIKDENLGTFTTDGKINGQIVTLENTNYYKDLRVTIENQEATPIKCTLDRDVDIDTDFDNRYDAKDTSPEHAVLEIPRLKTDELKDAIPGQVEQGTYQGKGRLLATYTAHCYFCTDDECDTYETRGEETKTATVRAVINAETLNTTTSNST